MAIFMTQIEGDTMMLVETETTGTFAKSDMEIKPNPMAAFHNSLDMASTMGRVIASRVSEQLAGSGVNNAEVQFGIKIDQFGSVLLAQEAEKCQFMLRLSFKVL